MRTALERVSKITAKGQTTVPKVVREALGVDRGGSITFRINEKGVVRLVRSEPKADTTGIAAFLDFLDKDMRDRPDALIPVTAEMAARIDELVTGIEVDPEDDFSDATPI